MTSQVVPLNRRMLNIKKKLILKVNKGTYISQEKLQSDTMNIRRRVADVVHSVNIFQVRWIHSERPRTAPERQYERTNLV